MVIKYLGTAAAEGMPAVFCRCPLCRKARERGEKDIRTRSQILIDDDVLIDFPMDSYMHALKYNLDLSAVRNVFITHAHMDHCYPQDFTTHGTPFAHDMTQPVIHVYGNETVVEKFIAHTRDEIKDNVKESVRLHAVKPYDVLRPDAQTTVTALPAKHTLGEDCLLYAVERNGKTALIMNDTGILEETVYVRLREMGAKFDLVSFDCTYGGKGKGAGRHMGLPDNVAERDCMRKHGLVNADTKYIVTHFSHNSGMLHEELDALAQAFGMRAAYDGMEVIV